jgi:hypothetical protein
VKEDHQRVFVGLGGFDRLAKVDEDLSASRVYNPIDLLHTKRRQVKLRQSDRVFRGNAYRVKG